MSGTVYKGLRPIGKNVLVKLGGRYEHIVAAAKTYESQTNGIVVAIGKGVTSPEFKADERVYWQEYREGSIITDGQTKYALVDIKDIQGASDV